MGHHVETDRESRPCTLHPGRVGPAPEIYPASLLIRRRPRTRLVWLVCLTLAGIMAEELEALATANIQQHKASVKIGKKYQLNSESRFTAVCDDSGCDSTVHEGPLFTDAILLVHHEAESGHHGPAITIAGNAIFVAPVTGTLAVDGFADPPISPEQQARLGCTNLRWKTKSLDGFNVKEVP